MSRLPRACTGKHLGTLPLGPEAELYGAWLAQRECRCIFGDPAHLSMHVVIEIKSRFAGRRSLRESVDDQVDNFVGNTLNVRCFLELEFPGHFPVTHRIQVCIRPPLQ